MLRLFHNIIESIFPLRDSARSIVNLTNKDMDRYLSLVKVQNVSVLLSYKEPIIRHLITEAKFHNNTHAQSLLAYALKTHLVSHQLTEHILIPIPLSSQRKRQRGYNQVTEILKRTKMANLIENILIRHSHTAPQTSLDRNARLKNVQTAFSLRDPDKISGQHIIIIDDVLTTGATLSSAAKIINATCPASLTLIALAH